VPPGQARGAVRFSLGETTTEEEIERAIVTAKRVVSRLRGRCLEQPAGAP
jgi:cysteine sulfinate desulfinase/cysteine desulfurase-like protein